MLKTMMTMMTMMTMITDMMIMRMIMSQLIGMGKDIMMK